MKCKHENADHLKPGEWWTCGQRIAPSLIQVEQFRCINCGAWLPLGPANDTPETAIELRAAELCSDPDDCAQFTQTEWAGYCNDETYSVGRCEPLRNFDISAFHWQAGWLARAIDRHGLDEPRHDATHKDGTP